MSRAPLLTGGTHYAVSGHGNSLYKVAPDMCLEPEAWSLSLLACGELVKKKSPGQGKPTEGTQALEYMLFFPVRAVKITVALTRPGRFVDSVSPFVRKAAGAGRFRVRRGGCG